MMCMYVRMCMCIQVPVEARGIGFRVVEVTVGCESPTVQERRIELRFSAGALVTLNHWAVPSALSYYFGKEIAVRKLILLVLLAKTVQGGA